jgi:ribosome-associated protein
MKTKDLLSLVNTALSDLKAQNIQTLDVQGISSITNFMVIASGNSNRHVIGITRHVAEQAKMRGEKPLGVEGEDVGEWALIDLGEIIVHVMQPDIRDFYELEKLWTRVGKKIG